MDALSERPRVLHVGTIETGGGAASVAGSLARALRARGCESWMAVGRRTSDDPDVFLLPDDHRPLHRLAGYAALQRALRRRAGASPGHGWGWLSRSLRLATHPRALADHLAGHEDFEFPGTRDLLNLPPDRPDIVHCHNLHGGFFDLGALSWLTHAAPTVLTLHDSWLLTGHCAHSFACDRWMTGCGSCPDLSIYPAIRRDATARNWKRKQDIYRGSRLYVTTPSSWLLHRVEQSMLAPAVELSRVIPNGVDVSIFKPGSQDDARRTLGLSSTGSIVLLMSGRRDRPWTDHETLGRVVDQVAESRRSVTFLALGDETTAVASDQARVQRVAFEKDPRRLALYYQAADMFLHCAVAATSPVSVLEALACGTPVVAAAVGGIGEQIRSLRSSGDSTGVLAGPGDPGVMAEAILTILEDPDLRRRLGENAARDARARFDRIEQVNAYLDWYRTIIDHWNAHVRFDTHQHRDALAESGRLP